MNQSVDAALAGQAVISAPRGSRRQQLSNTAAYEAQVDPAGLNNSAPTIMASLATQGQQGRASVTTYYLPHARPPVPAAFF